MGLPGGSDGKESARNEGDLGSVPGLGKSPGEGGSNPLQYSCLENSMDWGSWWAIVHGVTKSWTRLEWLNTAQNACEGSERERVGHIPTLRAAQFAWSLWTRVRGGWVGMERQAGARACWPCKARQSLDWILSPVVSTEGVTGSGCVLTKITLVAEWREEIGQGHKRHRFNPLVRKIPWRRAWQPTPVLLPREFPWTEEPSGLQSLGLQRVRHDWGDLAHKSGRGEISLKGF